MVSCVLDNIIVGTSARTFFSTHRRTYWWWVSSSTVKYAWCDSLFFNIFFNILFFTFAKRASSTNAASFILLQARANCHTGILCLSYLNINSKITYSSRRKEFGYVAKLKATVTSAGNPAGKRVLSSGILKFRGSGVFAQPLPAWRQFMKLKVCYVWYRKLSIIHYEELWRACSFCVLYF